MKRILLTLLGGLTILAQSTYQIATPGSVLTCTVTNVGFTPTAYNVLWLTPAGMRRYQSSVLPIPYMNFLSTTPSGIYSLQITMTGNTTNGVIETLPSTNIYVYWNPPPVVPGGPVGLTTR